MRQPCVIDRCLLWLALALVSDALNACLEHAREALLDRDCQLKDMTTTLIGYYDQLQMIERWKFTESSLMDQHGEDVWALISQVTTRTASLSEVNRCITLAFVAVVGS